MKTLQQKPFGKSAPSATVRIRAATGSETYREGFYFLLGVVKLLGVLVFCLTLLNLYIADTYVPQNSYYAENFENKLKPMYAFTEPIISQEALLKWSADAATEIMTFGFSDYDGRIWNSRFYFTPEGWNRFAPAFVESKLLKGVVNSQQIMVAVPRTTPTIIAEGVVRGKYVWTVQVPLLLSIRAGDNKATERVMVQLEVMKMPTTEMPAGIGIDHWISY